MDRQKRAGRQTHSRVPLGVFAYLSKHEGEVLARKKRLFYAACKRLGMIPEEEFSGALREGRDNGV